MNFLNVTTSLVSESSLEPKEIASGAGVGYRWFCYFKNGNYKDPGVKNIQKLYDFLSEKQLESKSINDCDDNKPNKTEAA